MDKQPNSLVGVDNSPLPGAKSSLKTGNFVNDGSLPVKSPNSA
jgi:hypothetical protein